MKRFLDKTEYVGECLIWCACKLPSGYGLFKLNGKTTLAHRAAWIINNGKIEGNLMVLHHCDNPSCVNVEHLYLGDAKQNMADKVNRNRFKNGQSEKQYCPHGHPYNKENTRVYMNKRFCRSCDSNRKRRIR